MGTKLNKKLMKEGCKEMALMSKDTYDYMRKATKKAVKKAGIMPKDLDNAISKVRNEDDKLPLTMDEEIKCIRAVLERILNHLNSSLFCDYQLEKWGRTVKQKHICPKCKAVNICERGGNEHACRSCTHKWKENK